MEELISIIVPVYNAEKYLNKCIKSIINQTYKKLEIILIDDGSTDNSGKIIDKWQKEDSRIIVIHKENEGFSEARNIGIIKSKGKYLSFIDNDDYIEVDFIESLYKSIIQNDSQIAAGGYIYETYTKQEIRYAREIYIENAEENIRKIRNSLSLVKDGQAVFTNLEKLYVYRYVFQKGQTSKVLTNITLEKIEIPENDIKNYLIQMYEDSKSGSNYENNTILQDNLLWLAREYQKQGIVYSEIASTDVCKKGIPGARFLEQIHEILPKAKAETGVDLRFLAGIRRIWLSPKEQAETCEVAKIMAKSPYVVGSDIIGEEITDIEDLSSILTDLVNFSIKENNGFTIRVHAGETDAFSSNVEKVADIIDKAIGKSKIIPRCRLGHGLYGIGLDEESDKRIINKIKRIDAVLEFQLSSNVRLNNLTKLENHPIKTYLENNVSCVQGTDGFGMYGTDTNEEQISLQNLLNITENDFQKMKLVEEKLISENKIHFENKSKEFEKFLNGRSITEAIIDEEYNTLKNLIN